jgi:hypothetical protein
MDLDSPANTTASRSPLAAARPLPLSNKPPSGLAPQSRSPALQWGGAPASPAPGAGGAGGAEEGAGGEGRERAGSGAASPTPRAGVEEEDDGECKVRGPHPTRTHTQRERDTRARAHTHTDTHTHTPPCPSCPLQNECGQRARENKRVHPKTSFDAPPPRRAAVCAAHFEAGPFRPRWQACKGMHRAHSCGKVRASPPP